MSENTKEDKKVAAKKKTASKTAAKKDQNVETKEDSPQLPDQEEQAQDLPFRNSENLVNSLEYEKDELGRIVWKKLIPKEHISPNISKCENRGKDPFKLTKEEILELPEDEQLILLQGFKDLADIRGYTNFSERVQYFDNRAVSTVSMSWLPIPETNNSPLFVETVGEAHFHNTTGFGNNYLARIASNRAFIANVKQVCRIPIYGQDEMGGESKAEAQSSNPGSVHLWELVENKYKDIGLTWEDMGSKIHDKYPETKKCSSFKDLGRFENVLKTILRGIKEHESKKKKEQEG